MARFLLCAIRRRLHLTESSAPSMTADADYQRTRYEANLDLDYKIRLYYLHERLYTRIHKNLRLLQLVGGSAAFASALGKNTDFMVASGALLAAIAYINLIFDFSERSRSTKELRKKLTSFKAESIDFSDQDFEKKMTGLAVEDEVTIQGLCKPAYNQNLCTHGRYSYQQKLNLWERLLNLLA